MESGVEAACVGLLGSVFGVPRICRRAFREMGDVFTDGRQWRAGNEDEQNLYRMLAIVVGSVPIAVGLTEDVA